MRPHLFLLLALASVASFSQLSATVTYTYTGNPFSEINGPPPPGLNRVTFSVQLDHALAPNEIAYSASLPSGAGDFLTWTMSDGAVTYYLGHSDSPFILGPGSYVSNNPGFIQAGPDGLISSWFLNVFPWNLGTNHRIATASLVFGGTPFTSDLADFSDEFSDPFSAETGTPGVWTMTTDAVPEPATWALALLGGLAMLVRARTRS